MPTPRSPMSDIEAARQVADLLPPPPESIKPREGRLEAAWRNLKEGGNDIGTIGIAVPALGEQAYRALGIDAGDDFSRALQDLAEASASDQLVRDATYARPGDLDEMLQSASRSLPSTLLTLPLGAAGGKLTAEGAKALALRSAMMAAPGSAVTAGQTLGEDLNKGTYSPGRMLLRSGLQGFLEAAGEAIPINGRFGGEATWLKRLLDQADSAGAGRAVRVALVDAGFELPAQGGQEAITGGMQSLADDLTDDEVQTGLQILQNASRNAYIGAGSGVLMGGALQAPQIAAAAARDLAPAVQPTIEALRGGAGDVLPALRSIPGGVTEAATAGNDLNAKAAMRAQLERAVLAEQARLERAKKELELDRIWAGLPQNISDDLPADRPVFDPRADLRDPSGQTPVERETALATSAIPTPPTASGTDSGIDDEPARGADPMIDTQPAGFAPAEDTRISERSAGPDTVATNGFGKAVAPPKRTQTQELDDILKRIESTLAGTADGANPAAETTVAPAGASFDQYLATTGMTAEQHAELSSSTADMAPWQPGDEKQVAVGGSKVHGKGIVAKQELPPNISAVVAVTPDGKRTPVGRYINHSDQPNSEAMLTPNGIELVPLRPIEAGEELTVDYNQSSRVQAQMAQQMQAAKNKPAPKGVADAGGAKTTGEIEAFDPGAEPDTDTQVGTDADMEPVTGTGTGTGETPTTTPQPGATSPVAGPSGSSPGAASNTEADETPAAPDVPPHLDPQKKLDNLLKVISDANEKLRNRNLHAGTRRSIEKRMTGWLREVDALREEISGEAAKKQAASAKKAAEEAAGRLAIGDRVVSSTGTQGEVIADATQPTGMAVRWPNKYEKSGYRTGPLNMAWKKIEPTAEATAPAKVPQSPVNKPGRKPVGTNAEGMQLEEDENGVRSYLAPSGVRHTEPVPIGPRKGGGVGLGTPDPAKRRNEFKTTEEQIADTERAYRPSWPISKDSEANALWRFTSVDEKAAWAIAGARTQNQADQAKEATRIWIEARDAIEQQYGPKHGGSLTPADFSQKMAEKMDADEEARLRPQPAPQEQQPPPEPQGPAQDFKPEQPESWEDKAKRLMDEKIAQENANATAQAKRAEGIKAADAEIGDLMKQLHKAITGEGRPRAGIGEEGQIAFKLVIALAKAGMRRFQDAVMRAKEVGGEYLADKRFQRAMELAWDAAVEAGGPVDPRGDATAASVLGADAASTTTSDDVESNQKGEANEAGNQGQADAAGSDAGEVSAGGRQVGDPAGGDAGGRSGASGGGLPGPGGTADEGRGSVPGSEGDRGEGDGTVPAGRGSDRGAGSAGRGRSAGGGGGSGGTVGGVRPGDAGAAQSENQQEAKPDDSVAAAVTPNWAYTESPVYGTDTERAKANIAAIETMKAVMEAGRPATPAEQAIMANYVGWGGVKWAVDPNNSRGRAIYNRLRELLTDREFEGIRLSAENAHYTEPRVVKDMWTALRRMGYNGGGMTAELGSGIGYFAGFRPADLAGAMTMIELDTVTGNMAKLLYPQHHVQVQGVQQVPLPSNSLALVVGNVPFDSKLIITQDKKFAKWKPNLHDYCFLKGVDSLHPGGIMMALTSTGTLDNAQHSNIRRELHRQADLIAAFRLPSGVFGDVANTEVVTDLIILRKRMPNEVVGSDAWVETGDVMVKNQNGYSTPVTINQYFIDNPDNILGTLTLSGTMYRANSKNVEMGPDFWQRWEKALAGLPKDQFVRPAPVKRPAFLPAKLPSPTEARDGNLVVQDGKLFIARGGTMEQVAKPAKGQVAVITSIMPIRNAVRGVLAAEQNDDTKATINAKAALNKAYDAFVAKHGTIRANQRMLTGDPDAPLLLALETENGKADIFDPTKRTVQPIKRPEKADTLEQAVALTASLNATVDIDAIAKLWGKSAAEVEKALPEKGLAFRDPANGWTYGFLYLSGNVRQKLAAAEAAAAIDKSFAPNVEALRAVIPADVPATKISFNMGSPWIPPSDISTFLAEMIGADASDLMLSWDGDRGRWTFIDVSRPTSAKDAASTPAWDFSQTVNSAMAGTMPTPKITKKDANGNDVLMPEETRQAVAEATAKVDRMRSEFKRWLFKDEERRTRLVRIYNDTVNNMVMPVFDGSHLTFPGMRSDWQTMLRSYQRNAIWRIVTMGRSILAHEVGAGKTATMIAAAMEMRRMGLANKPAIVCLKANVDAIANDARAMYPNAKIINISSDMGAKQRKQTAARIAAGDYDLVVMTHPNIDMLTMSPETIEAFKDERIAELERELTMVTSPTAGRQPFGRRSGRSAGGNASDNSDRKKERELRAAIKKEREYWDTLIANARKDDAVTFEETGIDFLMIDEAHFYKKLGTITQLQNVKGIAKDASNKARLLWMKTKYLQQRNGMRGVVMSTGTPVTNTLGELFNMQRYVQPDTLENMGVQSFDGWRQTFADVTHKPEFTHLGTVKPTSRLAEFGNLPELKASVGNTMDVVRIDQVIAEGVKINRPKRIDQNVEVEATPEQQEQRKYLLYRSLTLPKPKDRGIGSDTPVAITGDGRKAATGMSLLRDGAGDSPKAIKAAEMVAERLEQFPGTTHFLFSDVGVQKTSWGYSFYDDVINQLVAKGIPREKIVDFRSFSGNSDAIKARRQAAIARLQTGDAVVAIGSTATLGTGVNAQAKIKSIIHLDAPFMPGELEQREGRGYRSGNTNAEIFIDRIISVGSMDAFMWQLLAAKRKFIDQTMNIKNQDRTGVDKDMDRLSDEATMAAASGNPHLMRFVELQEDIRRLEEAKDAHIASQMDLQDNITKDKREIALAERQVAAAESGMRVVSMLPRLADIKTMVAGTMEKVEKIGTPAVGERSGTKLVASVGLIDIFASVYNRGESAGGRTVEMKIRVRSLDGDVTQDLEIETSSRTDDGLAGVIHGVDKQMARFRDNATNRIKDLQRALGVAERKLAEPFEGEDQLKSMRDEMDTMIGSVDASLVSMPKMEDFSPEEQAIFKRRQMVDNYARMRRSLAKLGKSPAEIDQDTEHLRPPADGEISMADDGDVDQTDDTDDDSQDDDIQASIPDPTLEPTDREIAAVLTPESAKRIAGPYATVTRENGQYRLTGRGGVEVFIRLPKSRDEMRLARDTKAAGFYDPATNSIILVPSKASPFTLTHELIHLFKGTGLISDSEWRMLVDAHASDPAKVRAKVNAYTQNGMPLTDEAAQEELVAEALEKINAKLTQDPPGVLAKLRRFFRAIAIGLGLRRLDAEDVERSILRGDMLGRAPRRTPSGGPVASLPSDPQAARQDIASRSAAIDAAYERGDWETAESMDAGLEQDLEEAENRLADTEEGQDLDNGEDSAEPIGQLVSRWAKLEGGYPLSPGRSKADFLRGVDQQAFAGLSDAEMEAMAADAYDQRQALIARMRGGDGAVRRGGQTVKLSIPDEITAQDPEVEKALRGANGIGTATLKDKANSWWERAKQWTRHFSYLKTDEHAEAIAVLRKAESEIAASGHLAARIIESHVVGLSPAEMRAFERKLVFDDLLKDVDAGLYEDRPLPFSFSSADALREEAARVDAYVDKHPAIRDAIDKRVAFQAEHVRKLVEHGMLPSEVLRDPVYYHHMVLAHARAQVSGEASPSGASAGIRQQSQGWQRARVGSAEDYNTNFVQAEYEYLSSSLRELAKAEALAKLGDLYDISTALKADAKSVNRAAMDEWWVQQNTPKDGSPRTEAQIKAIEQGWDMPFRRKLARASTDLIDILADGVLPLGAPFDDLQQAAKEYKDQMEQAKLDGVTPLNDTFDHPDWWKFLAWAAEEAPTVQVALPKGGFTTMNAGMPARSTFKAIADREKMVKSTLARKYTTWRDLAKERGYALWQPEPGLQFALMETPTSIAIRQALAEAGVKETDEVDVLSVSTKGMKKSLVVIGARPQWAIPQALADQLNSMKVQQTNDPSMLLEGFSRMWKALILNNPLRAPAFFLNNLVGDIDIALTHPRIFKQVPKASQDLYAYLYKAPMDQPTERMMREAERLGLLDAGQSVSELPDLDRETWTRRIYGEGWSTGAIAREAGRTLVGQGGAVRQVHQLREGVLRLAAYRQFLAEIDPKNRKYGASSLNELNQLYDAWQANPSRADELRKTIAAKLARELLGDYGNLSVGGQWARRTLVPFWSWLEINAPRYYRLLRNAHSESTNGTLTTGEKVGHWFASAPRVAVGAASFYAGAMLWNAMMKSLLDIGDDEDPNKDMDWTRYILIMGKSDDGTVHGVRAAGALADALGWLGMANAPTKLEKLKDAYRRGELDQGVAEVAKDVGMAPVNRMANAVTPLIKAPAELAFKQSVFPDVLNPRQIRDRGQYVAGTLGVKPLYDWYTDRSDIGDVPEQSILKSRNPGAQAWFDARNLVFQYAEREGIQMGSGTSNDKANALFEARSALARGDEERAQRWLGRYLQAGGTARGLVSSVNMLNPVNRLPVHARQKFLQSLSAEQRAKLAKGTAWWKATLAGPDDLKRLLQAAARAEQGR